MAKITSFSPKYVQYEEKKKLTTLDKTKNSGSTIGYVAGNLGLGALGILEGSYNLVEGGLSSIFGGEEGGKYAQYLFSNSESSKLTQKLNESYNPGKGMQFAGEVAQGIGQSSVFYLNALGIPLGTILFFSGAAGQGVSEAVQQTGQLGLKEYGYGITSGAVEGALELLSGAAGAGLGKAGKTLTGTLEKALGKVGKETAKHAVRNGVVKSIISGSTSEFFEEFLGAYAEVAMKHIYQIDPNAQYSFADAVYQGLVGAASGGLMEGTQTAVRATFSHARGAKIISEGKADALVSTVKTMQDQVKSKDWSKYYKAEEKKDVRGFINNLVAAYEAYQNLAADQKTGDRAKVYLGEMQTNLAILEAIIGRENMIKHIRDNADKYVKYAEEIRGEKFTAEDIKNDKNGILTQLGIARWALMFNDVETVWSHRQRFITEQIAKNARKGIDTTGEGNAVPGSAQTVMSRAGVTKSGIEWNENDDGGVLTRVYDLGNGRNAIATEEEDGTWTLGVGTGETLLTEEGENLKMNVKTDDLDTVVANIRDNYDDLIETARQEQQAKEAESKETKKEKSGEGSDKRKSKSGNVVKGENNVKYATAKDLEFARLDPNKTVKSALNAKQKATLTLLSKWFDKSGYQILVFEGNGYGANGAYRGNTIYLDINASMLQIAAHELTHSFVKRSPAMYGKLRNFIIKTEFKGDQAKIDAAIDKITELYARNGEELSRDVAEEEIIAKSCENVFGSVKALKDMFAFDDRLFGEANRYLGTMEAFFDSIIQSYGAENEYASAMSESVEDLKELRKRFAEAMRASLKPNQTKKAADGDARLDIQAPITDLKKSASDVYTEEILAENARAVVNGKSIKDIVKHAEFNEAPSEFVREQLTKLGSVFNKILGDIRITNNGIRSDIRHGLTKEKVTSVLAVKDVIENGKIVLVNTIEGKPGVERLMIAAPITIENVPYYMGVMVQRDSASQSFYLHDVITAKKDLLSNTNVAVDSSRKGTVSQDSKSYTNIILQKALSVNDDSVKKSISAYNLSEDQVLDAINRDDELGVGEVFRNKDGEMTVAENVDGTKSIEEDSNGNALSKGQQTYFADSKVRDEKGRLIKVYHGTANGGKFTVFDGKKLNNSKLSSHIGQGFYFTNSESGAKEYMTNRDAFGRVSKGTNPNLFSGYLNIEKPLYITESSRQIGYETIRDIVAAGDNEWFFKKGIAHDLQNKDIDGKKYTKQEIEGMSLGERISLYSRYLARYGDMTALNNFVDAYQYGNQDKLLKAMQTYLGNDGIIWKMREGLSQYVAFNSNQFKNADNVNPTEDQDIRYSLQEIQNASDKEYLELANDPKKNRKRLEEMVEDAAKKAFPDSKLIIDGKFRKMWHHANKKFNSFLPGMTPSTGGLRGIYFTPQETSTMSGLGETHKAYYLNVKNLKFAIGVEADKHFVEELKRLQAKAETREDLARINREFRERTGIDAFFDWQNGWYNVLDERLIKSADPIVYDDDGSVIPLSKRFNDEDADLRHSIDSDGNKLSEDQSRYFANSQVRDREGRLLPMYHGTGADFAVFDRGHIGSYGRMEGSGFNFTPSYSRAKTYSNGGKVMSGYLNIVNPISSTKRTITARQLAGIIAEIDPTGDNIISNYADDTRDYGSKAFVRRESYVTAKNIIEWAESDADIYSELSAANPDADSLIDKFKLLGYDGVIHYDQDGNIRTAVAFDSNQFKLADNVEPTASQDVRYSIEETEEDVRYSRVTDEKTLDFLNNQKTVKVYRAMQVIDGKLYPPMAAKLKSEDGKKWLVEPTDIGTWYQSDEHPELIRNGKFTLDKANGSAIEAAYNPYFHTSTTPLNDQFSSAYKRDNLVTVEGEIPVSELSSGYKAQYAKDPVGMMTWHNGPVAGKLKGDKARKVILSRYFKADRIVPDSEVADVISKTLEGENIPFPSNVITPQLRAELEKRGVEIEDVRHSYDFSKPFAEQIEDLANNEGIINPRDVLVIGPTPKVYQDIGLLPLPMTYSQKHAKDALINADGDHLGKELLKKIPQALENPIAIIDSESKPGRLVAIIELPGDPRKTLAAVDVNGQGKVNSIRINSNYVASVHSRKNAISTLLKNAVESESKGNGGIYYWDKKKAIQVARKSGVQFPGGSQIPDGIVRIIHDSQSKVKSKLKNIFESKQFKAWFGHSKVKNTDGTPKLMYHGTAADFEAFDRNRIGQYHNDSAFWDDETGKFVDVGDEHFWFTADESLAKDHAEGAAEMSGGKAKVLSGYLRVSHPLIITIDEWYASRKHYTTQDWYDKNRKQILDEYHAGDYDGIIIKNPINGTDEMVGISNPNQFKSEDNIGTYDAKSDKFRYSIPDENGKTKEVKYTAEEQDEARSFVDNFDAYMPETKTAILEFLRSAKGTKADRKTLRMVSNIIAASDTLDVRFADTEQNGVYVRGEGGQQLILIDSKLDSAAAIRKVISAEMIHMAEQSGEGYDKFARLVLAVTSPEEQEKVKTEYKEFWKESGIEISDKDLLHEAVSELGSDVIQDYDLVEKWAQKDKTFVMKLLSAARSVARSLFGKDREAYKQAAKITAALADALTAGRTSGEPVIRYELNDRTKKPISEREKLQDQARAIHLFTLPRARQLIDEYINTLIKPYFTEGSGSPHVPTLTPRNFGIKPINIPTGTELKTKGLDGIVRALYERFYDAADSKRAKEAANTIADLILAKTYLGDSGISVLDAVKSKDPSLASGIRSAISSKIYDALTGGEAESVIDSVRRRYENMYKGLKADAARRESEMQRQIDEAQGVMKSTLQAIEQISRARRQYKDGYYRYQGSLAAPEIRLLTDAVIAAKSRGGYLVPENVRKALIAFNNVFRIEQLKSDLNEEYEVLGMNVETLKELDYLVNQTVKDYDEKNEGKMTAALTAAEVETFADVARATAQLYRTYNKYYDERRKQWIDADETAKRGIDVVEDVAKLREADPKLIKGMREIMNKYGIETLDPLAVSRLLDGYDDDGIMTEIITDIINAENAKTLRIRNYMRDVDEYIKKTKGFEKHLTAEEDMIEYRGVKMTRDEFIQLYMTTFRKQALLHLALGRTEIGTNGSKCGMRIIPPAIDVSELTGSTDKVETPSIDELLSSAQVIAKEIQNLGNRVLTAEDKEYIALMEKFYNKVSTKDKSDTDYKYFGMTNVVNDPDDKYVPIVTSGSSRASSITDERSSMLDFATLAGQSFNKNTIRGAKNPLSITGAYGLMQKHANGLAAYAELYAPMQKLDRIWSTDINHNRQNSKRLRDVLKNTYGDNVEKYVRNLMGDIQGINAKKPNAFNAIIGRMRSNYAIFQLGANPKTWFNQLGSMGALFRFCDLDSVAKGLTAPNLDKMAEYSSAAAIREGGDVVVKAQTLTNQVSGKVKDLMMKPIGWSDMKIVSASWGACQYQIEKEKGYAIGSEDNLKAAGELLNKVINESQDTSLASTKTGIARSDNELIRSLAMFRSAPFKQYSRMTDAIGTLSVLSAKKKAGREVSAQRFAEAKRELARTGAGWALQALIGVAVTLLFNWLYDKDKEVNAKELALDYSSELISVIPVVGDLYNYLASGYDMSYFAFDMLNDSLAAAQNTVKTIGRAISGDRITRQDVTKVLNQDLTAFGQFSGLPTRNVKNVLVGLTKRISSIFGGALGYSLDAAMYSKSYQSDLQAAIEDGNTRLAERIVELLYQDKKAVTKASEAAVSEVVRLYGEGFTQVLPPSVSSTITVDGVEYDVTAKDQKKIRQIANGADAEVTGLINSQIYKSLDDADKAKAIGKLYDIYYDRALTEVFGVPMTKADAISRIGDAKTIFAAAAHIANISADKDESGKTITNSRKQKVNDYLMSLGLDTETMMLVLYASGYTSDALKSQVGNIAATADLDADTYADVYGALGLAS